MFKDYNENGEQIAGYNSGEPTVRYRVDRAVARQMNAFDERYKDRGIHVFGKGESEFDAKFDSKQKMDQIIRDMLQSVYNAAEAEVLSFIKSGADVIGRFPRVYYSCFSLSDSDGSSESYGINYFDYLRKPAVISEMQAVARFTDQLKREWRGILLRIFLLLMVLPAFFVTLSWEGVQQFAKYEELVRGLFQAPIVERVFSCLLYLLFLLPYLILDFRYRDRNSANNPWILTFVQGYFFITALLYTFLRPIRSRDVNFMVEGILWSFYCFIIFLPVELRRLYNSLNSRRMFCNDFKASRTELDNARRLLLFYRIWWKAERRSGMHPVVEEAQKALDALYEQYESGGKARINR